MTDQMSKHDATLFSLVMSLQSMAMVQLGKLANPQTGQIERDLEGARGTIDILDMLKAKCRDNTHDELVKMLDQMVMDLQMNFLDESRKAKAEAEGAAGAEAGAGTGAEAATGADGEARATGEAGDAGPDAAADETSGTAGADAGEDSTT